MPVDHQLELSVDSDLHCSSPVVCKAVLLDEVHVVPYPYSRDGAYSLNETDRQMVRRENGRSRRGGSRWAAKVPTDIC